MNEKSRKKTRSIARRINLSQVAGLFAAFLVVDILVLWIYARQAVDFHAWGVHIEPAVFLNALYQFRWLYVVEGVLLLWDLLFGTIGIRKKLRPLDEMADAANRLSRAGLDEAQFHDLESAIEKISPTREDAMLHTGNQDLVGLEKAVNNLLSRMRESYRQQARFVSDASHELRTPIAVIQGYANMLDRWGKEDEKILNESIEAIKTESDHMKKLVEQLLFLARGDSGKTQLKMEKADLSALMREVKEESAMIDEKHTYTLIDSEGVFAAGDMAMLKQTARILVENAAKYTPEGEEIKLKAGVKEGNVAFFTVQDSGIGMAQEDIPHVFERFYRADSSRTRETGGTGLGLAIAKWIVDKHGGWFEVLSREELGTRITVCLPQPAPPKTGLKSDVRKIKI